MCKQQINHSWCEICDVHCLKSLKNVVLQWLKGPWELKVPNYVKLTLPVFSNNDMSLSCYSSEMREGHPSLASLCQVYAKKTVLEISKSSGPTNIRFSRRLKVSVLLQAMNTGLNMISSGDLYSFLDNQSCDARMRDKDLKVGKRWDF